MVTKPIPVKVETDHDAMAAIEAVVEDGVPREIERGGKIIAVVQPATSESLLPLDQSPEALRKALAAGGSWKGKGGENLAEQVHKWRDESPPSPPVDF
jgi:hypothetical protein